jgi:hypothetical protein
MAVVHPVCNVPDALKFLVTGDGAGYEGDGDVGNEVAELVETLQLGCESGILCGAEGRHTAYS